ncbi:MAG: hypothetical protein ACRECQ_10235 [Burkholderiaceae bacterium]
MNAIEPSPNTRLVPALIGVLCFVAVAPVDAQEGYVDAVGAYNRANVMTRPHVKSTGKRPEDASRQAGSRSDKTFTKEQMALLQDEYDRRVMRNGKNETNAWLARRLNELSKQYRYVE